MTLMTEYDEAIARGDIDDDALQRDVILSLQRLADAIQHPRHFWFRPRQKALIQGLYIHGPVGAGKTFLMDLFYRSLNERHKSRMHFHQFMQQVDGQLRRLQGQVDPLKKIARTMAKTVRVLCLDEFLVQDIATAMILAELLQFLYAEGLILVMTSNTCPDNLYLNGLQRVRFLPAIALIKKHSQVLNLAEQRDYRLGRTPLAKTYLHPLNASTDAIMEEQFNQIAQGQFEHDPLIVQGREIKTLRRSGQAVWFEFDAICYLPRSQLDYLEIAQRFTTVFVSHIPELTEKDTVRALLLTHFIDVMYDCRVRVVLSAAVPIDKLYLQGEVSVAFKRTKSRLQEMQSVDYLR